MTSIDLEDDVLLISDPVKRDNAIRALNKKRADRGEPPVYLNATSSQIMNIDPLYVEEIERQLSVEQIPHESVQICSVQSSDGTKTWRTMRPDVAFQVVCSSLFTLQKKNAALENNVWNEKIKTKSNKKFFICLTVFFIVICICLVSIINTKDKELSDAESQLNSCIDLVREMEDEYTFYHKNAALVTPAGEKYHRFGCKHISGRSVKVYDIRTALLEGYRACYDCCYN